MKPTLVLILCTIACADSPQSPSSTRYGTLAFSPCSIGPSGATVSAQCATLEVPEDRSNPSGRFISLAVAWLAKAQPDPVFLIAGGPGLAARATYAAFGFGAPELTEHHDLILVDQRGLGASSPLSCTSAHSSDEEDEGVETSQARLRACAAELSKGADVRFYSTTEAVLDLDRFSRILCLGLSTPPAWSWATTWAWLPMDANRLYSFSDYRRFWRLWRGSRRPPHGRLQVSRAPRDGNGSPQAER